MPLLKLGSHPSLFRIGIPFLMLGFLAVLASLPMIEQGYPSTHSTQFNLIWAFQYHQQFVGGQFYPRWLEFSNFGFGNATFAFYPPLCMVAALPFLLLGWDVPTALVGSMGLAIFLLGWGLYGYSRCFFPTWIALGIGGVGMLAPYFLVDIYQRGAIGEVWAMVTLPWIGWAGERLRRQAQSAWPILGLALAYGLLVLSHLPTLLIFTLLWIPWPWIVALPGQRWSLVLRTYAGMALAFCWTAFYLWPATLDQRWIQVGSVNADPEYQPQNRLMVKGLTQFQPQFTQHWFEKPLVNVWLVMGAVTLLVGVVWVIMVWYQPKVAQEGSEETPPPRSDLGRVSLYWWLVAVVSLLMMTDLLSWIYPLLTPLKRIQFSWRWMSLTSVVVPLLLGYGLHQSTYWVRGWRRLGAGILAVACFGLMAVTVTQGSQILEKASFNPREMQIFTVLAQAKARLYPQEPQVPLSGKGDPFLYWHWIFPDGMAFVDVPEYRARGVTYPMPPQQPTPLLAWQSPSLNPDHLQLQQWQFGIRRFQAINPSQENAVALVRTFYYPGWSVQMDGRRIPTEKTAEGQLQVTIPTGEHQVRITYQGTWADGLGRAVSFLTVWVVLGMILRPQWLSRIPLEKDRLSSFWQRLSGDPRPPTPKP
ncbi:MAG: hypothetical protein NW237_11200 [Cyanobacteriota bacterium]|nr:hypothetical protein [Cyanobacteriota bacterium]